MPSEDAGYMHKHELDGSFQTESLLEANTERGGHWEDEDNGDYLDHLLVWWVYLRALNMLKPYVSLSLVLG